jgi:hypothetical protein
MGAPIPWGSRPRLSNVAASRLETRNFKKRLHPRPAQQKRRLGFSRLKPKRL